MEEMKDWHNNIVHVPCFLKEDASPSDLLQRVHATCNTDQAAQETPPLLCLAGLHACGMLSVTMFKLWMKSPQIHSVVSVGCCYYKMTQSPDESSESPGSGELCTGPFPLSHAVQQLHFNIGKGGLKLACEGIVTWMSKSRSEFDYMVKHTFYRCVAQDALHRLFPEDYSKLYIKGGISRGYCDSLMSYVRRAISRLRHRDDDNAEAKRSFRCISDDELRATFGALDPQSEQKLVCFLLLRALIAQVLESYIVIDRYLYIREQAQPSDQIQVRPIFAESVSPRNLCIIATKGC